MSKMALQESQKTWVRSLGWEDPLEKGMPKHSSILARTIPWTEDLAGCSPWGHKESDMTEQLSKRKPKTTKGRAKGTKGLER